MTYHPSWVISSNILLLKKKMMSTTFNLMLLINLIFYQNNVTVICDIGCVVNIAYIPFLVKGILKSSKTVVNNFIIKIK